MMEELEFSVSKRNGQIETMHVDKLYSRILKLCYGLNENFVSPLRITSNVIGGLYPGVETAEIDNYAAEVAASLTTDHSDYAILAGRIAISKLHRETKKQFSEVVFDLYNMTDKITGKPTPIISDIHYNIIMENANNLDSVIVYGRDYEYDYFGFKTLEKSYLLRIHGKVVERPQHMLMRVAIGIHGKDIPKAIETYNLMSTRIFIHASPTLFNAATPRPQLSSCFLLGIKDDSIEGIYDTLKQCALISKNSAGIGIHIHSIRAKGSYIAGTNGKSNGIVPMLRVFNNTARYVDQGGRRPGAFAIYLEPWHADIMEFLDLKKNTGAEELRARDLFYALWVPDLFMKRVLNDQIWSLMCPHDCPGLADVWGEEFEKLYVQYENEGKYLKQVQAKKLMDAIVISQIETGTPYILYKDNVNRKSNQQNLGTIKSSNLCAEIVEFTSNDEIAVCNLASIAVNMFIGPDKKYDFAKLKEVTKVITRNLNKIIDITYYPIDEAKKSNLRHRPIAIGIQGLADLFIMLRQPFDSIESQQLNVHLFETIYFGALEASNELAKEYGAYETYPGSPISRGLFQFDLWEVKPSLDLWDWDILKRDIMKYGVRNSLLVGLMPTASTAQILGNNESFEPYTSNIYTRRVLSGEFQIVNHHLLKDLVERGLWSKKMKNKIIKNNGSIQKIDEIPDELKALYKTVWEISQRKIIKMAAERGAFIDQSQSLNLYLADNNKSKVCALHFYAWRVGLKTGMYYSRTRPSTQAIQFTVDEETPEILVKMEQITTEQEKVEINSKHRTQTNSEYTVKVVETSIIETGGDTETAQIGTNNYYSEICDCN